MHSCIYLVIQGLQLFVQPDFAFSLLDEDAFGIKTGELDAAIATFRILGVSTFLRERSETNVNICLGEFFLLFRCGFHSRFDIEKMSPKIIERKLAVVVCVNRLESLLHLLVGQLRLAQTHEVSEGLQCPLACGGGRGGRKRKGKVDSSFVIFLRANRHKRCKPHGETIGLPPNAHIQTLRTVYCVGVEKASGIFHACHTQFACLVELIPPLLEV